MNERRGFTMIELLTALIVMGIISGVAMMSFSSARQTARREAEKVQAYIYRLMQRADRTHKSFEMNVGEKSIWINEYPPLESSSGCSYANNFDGNPTYNPQTKILNKGGHIDVHGADGKTWRVIFATATEGRVRIEESTTN